MRKYGINVPKNLVRYDDPGNINYAVTLKIKGGRWTWKETFKHPLVFGASQFKAGVMGGGQYYALRSSYANSKEHLKKKFVSFFDRPIDYLNYLRENVNPDDAHDQAAIEWGWDHSHRFWNG